MTWNFALLALDQVVNAAAKMLYMSGGQFNMPIVFRGPNGAALQLAAQHSQAWESWLAHIPGLKVVTPGTPADAKGLLKSAIRDDNPVIVLEGEMLYNIKGDVPDEEYLIPLGKADSSARATTARSSPTARWSSSRCRPPMQLAKEGIEIDVIDLRTIRPMDVEAIAAVGRARPIAPSSLEEGWEICGIGAQIVDFIQRDCFDDLDAPVIRVHQADTPMPYAKNLERAAKPDAAKTIAAVKRVMYIEACDGDQGGHGGALADDGRGASREWLKNEGDPSKTGDVLAEVETDKAVMELAARGDGVLRKRLVPKARRLPSGRSSASLRPRTRTSLRSSAQRRRQPAYRAAPCGAQVLRVQPGNAERRSCGCMPSGQSRAAAQRLSPPGIDARPSAGGATDFRSSPAASARRRNRRPRTRPRPRPRHAPRLRTRPGSLAPSPAPAPAAASSSAISKQAATAPAPHRASRFRPAHSAISTMSRSP